MGTLLPLLAAGFIVAPVHAQWVDVATVSGTLGNNAGRLCVGGGRTEIGCPTNTPFLNSAAGLLTVPTDLRVTGNLYVSGSQQFDGVTFANGGVSATGAITATTFTGDGSGLTNVTASSADWYNLTRIPLPVQAVSDGKAIVMQGISATNISTTSNLTIGGAVTAASAGFGPVAANSISTTGNGRIGTDLYVGGSLYVSGSQTIEGVSFANGGVSATGAVTATSFSGDGSALSNVTAANVDWYNVNRIPLPVRAVSDGKAIIMEGVTATNISATNNLTVGGALTAASAGFGPLAATTISTTGLVSANTLYTNTGRVNNDFYIGGNLFVSGSQSIDGVSFANGGVSATGSVTATAFSGNGAGLTNVHAASADWYTLTRIPLPVQAVSDGKAIAMQGISATNISTTSNLTVGGALTAGTAGFGAVAANSISTTGTGRIGTDLYVTGNLYVSGSQSIDGVSFANGGVSATGAVTATSFSGDGSGITNVTAANVDWYNVNRIPLPVRAVSDGKAIVMQGVTATNISATNNLTVGGALTAASAGFGPVAANSISTTGTGRIGTDLYIGGNLYVSGSQSIDGVSFANGGISATGAVTATSFSGDGTGLTNVHAASADWYILTRIPLPVQAVSDGKAIVMQGISSTNISVTSNATIGGALTAASAGFGPVAANSISTTGNGRIGADLYVGGNLFVSGSQTIEGVSFANGGVSATGTVTATSFSGSGAGLTGVPATGLVAAGSVGSIQFKGNAGEISGSSLMVWDAANARFNIGTSSGNAPFNLYANTGGAMMELRNANSSGYSGAELQRANGVWGAFFGYQESDDHMRFNVNTGSHRFFTNSIERLRITNGGLVGINTNDPKTQLEISGTLKIANGGESCDTNRLGAIKYAGNEFQVCRTSVNGWEPIATGGISSTVDRIVSASQAGVFANSTGYVSLTTGGVTGTVYFDPAGRLVNSGVSTTGPVSATRLFATGPLTLKDADTNLSISPYQGGGTSGVVDITTNGSMAMWVGNNRRMFMSSYGNTMLGSNLNGTYYDPSSTLQVMGTLQIAATGDACDANRLGAIKYQSGQFYVCRNGSTWETLIAANGGSGSMDTDRITSGTTSVLTSQNGSVTITTGGTQSMVVGTNGYIGIGTPNPLANIHVQTVTGASGAIRLSRTNQGGLVLSSPVGNPFNGSINFINAADAVVGKIIYDQNFGLVGIKTGASNAAPSTTFHIINGSLRLAAETSTTLATCDANRQGAIKYESNQFYVCRNGTAWETLVAGGAGSIDTDRITSGTLSVIGNTSGNTVSLSTSGVTWGYFGSTASYLPYLNATTISATRVSSTNISGSLIETPFMQLTGVAGSAGVSLTIAGADNLGNHTATQALDMATYAITNAGLLTTTGVSSSGPVTATIFYGSGAGLTNIPASAVTGLNLDRITSGTLAVIGNTSGNTVSLSTSGVTWGYFGSAASYLPYLSAQMVSSTNISASILQLASLPGSAGISLTIAGADNLGNHTATQALDMATYAITNAGLLTTTGVSSSGPVTATIFYGSGAGLTNIPATAVTGLNLDRITSGTLAVIGNTSGNTVSLSTSGITWGYLGATASYLPTLTASSVSSSNISTSILQLTSITGSPGVSLTIAGADNLGNHTATKALDMATYAITNAGLLTTTGVSSSGPVTATIFYGSGAGLTNIPASAVTGLNLDRITSGTASVTANSTTSIISLTAAGATWGYLGSAASYLPRLNTLMVSSTNISATALTINGVPITGMGVSTLASLTDVSVTTPVNNSVLTYDGSISKWRPVSVSAVLSTTTMMPNWPDAIYCVDLPNAYTLFQVGLNTSTDEVSYGLPGGSGRISFNRTTQAYSSRVTLNATLDCVSNAWSIPQLYAQGKAFNFIGTNLTSAASPNMGLQYSNNGIQAADSRLTYNSTTNVLGVLGTVSATNFIGSGAGLTNIPASAVTGLNLDRITSGTTSVTANSTTSIISLTTAGTTWGYLGNALSYLPNLRAPVISSTNISATTVQATNFIGNGSALTGIQAQSSPTNVPAFRAHFNGTDYSFTPDVDSTLKFTTKEFDTFNNYNSSNGYFTPNVPGYYLMLSKITRATGTNYYCTVTMRKNGTNIGSGTNSNSALEVNFSTVVYLNGTDYVQIVANCSGYSFPAVNGANVSTYFSGSLLASGNGTITGPTTLSGLTDVNIPAPTSGTVLTYNGSTSKWVSLPAVSSLSALTDVSITTPVNNSVLTYDGSISKWRPVSVSAVLSTTTMIPNIPDAIICSRSGYNYIMMLAMNYPAGNSGQGQLLYNFYGNSDYIYFNTTTGAATSGSSGYASFDCASSGLYALYAQGKAFNFIGTNLTSAASPNMGLQYSNNGIQAADSRLTYNSTTNVLSVLGNVSATTISTTALTINGVAITAGASGDRITSGTTTMAAISTTGYISLTTAGSNWGYFGSGLSYLPFLHAPTVSASLISATNISGTVVDTPLVRLRGVSGSAGVSLSAAGADNLGNHTATQNLNMAGFNILNAGSIAGTGLNVTGNISASSLTINGVSITAGASGDRITSGTTAMTAISTTGYISLTNAGTNWGYFSSGLSYLPFLHAPTVSSSLISATNISGTVVDTPLVRLRGVSGSVGISLSIAGADNLGNHTATQGLNMATFNITGAGVVSATGTIKTTAALQTGNTDTSCSTNADYGKIRFDSATKKAYLCRP